jgi:outer membrane protein OmpA-like peptidoglycan-associated protein
MARTGTLRRVSIGFLTLVASTALLGGCSSQKKQQEATAAELQEYKERYAALETESRNRDARIADLEQRLSAAQTAAQQAQAQQAAVPTPAPSNDMGGGGGGGGGNFVNDNGRIVAEMSGDVLFDPGQTSVKADARKRLDSIASEIKRKYSGSSIRIEGHTDRDPIRKSKFASNQALSEARAESVRSYLASKGISSSRMEAVGMGSSQPKSTKAASRRVDIVILR